MRVIGLDLGKRRIGLAVSDTSGVIATPHSYLEIPKTSSQLAVLKQKLPALVHDLGAQAVVVGLPLSLSGKAGPAAKAAQAIQQQLSEILEIPVLTHDERHTTTIASQALKETSLSGPKRRLRIDKVAAAVMLQSWLDLRANHEVNPLGGSNASQQEARQTF